MKKLIPLILSLILSLSLFACGKIEPTTATFTVTDENDQAHVGVQFTLTSAQKTYENLETDENGKITVALLPGNYTVTFTELPETYSGETASVTVTDAGEYELKIVKTAFFFIADTTDDSDPTQIVETMSVTIPANMTLTCHVFRARGREMRVSSTAVTVTLNGTVVTPTADIVAFNLQGEQGDTFTPGVFQLTNASNAAVTVTLTLISPITPIGD